MSMIERGRILTKRCTFVCGLCRLVRAIFTEVQNFSFAWKGRSPRPCLEIGCHTYFC